MLRTSALALHADQRRPRLLVGGQGSTAVAAVEGRGESRVPRRDLEVTDRRRCGPPVSITGAEVARPIHSTPPVYLGGATLERSRHVCAFFGSPDEE